MKFKLALLMVAAALPAWAANEIQRPHIYGISHVAFYVHDIEKTRAFYKDFLGFAEPYSLTNKNGTLHLTWIKINDRQTIELFPESPTNAGMDRLYHVALETDDAVGMRDYLASHGVKAPAKVGKGKIGNLNYFVRDPNGRIVEIVQYAPDSWTVKNQGKFMPDTRIATNMPHVGILTGDLAAAQNFYQNILGFREIWRGSKNPAVLSWVHEQVPDGTDFLELMLYSNLPPQDKRGKYHHLCLQVPDLEKAKAILASRAAQIGYAKPMEIQTGVNHKRQLNLYDPDGTRVELMEPRTFDGLAVPSSSAPPPQPATQTTQK
ncbi:MAG TPA: VOC family protein [Candidatus Saccharimonadales bacterium]|nr:VOC family protein [Candidatus Saccharimonadales bacterium]